MSATSWILLIAAAVTGSLAAYLYRGSRALSEIRRMPGLHVGPTLQERRRRERLGLGCGKRNVRRGML